MCLHTITHGPNPTEEGVGWKVFSKSPDDSLQSVFSLSDPKHYHLAATNAKPYQTYLTGFHLFQRKEDAEELANSIF